MEEDIYEMMFKVVLVGDSFVGKTNIMSKYLKNEFHEDSKATVGVEFGSKQFLVDGHPIKAQIWDTAGTERYKAITSAYYKGAKGAFVVYDITKKDTFKSVDKWVSDLTSAASQNIIIMVVGNKNDLEEQRQISKEEGENKARELNVAFLETSALTGDNLDKAFEIMMNEMYNKNKEAIESGESQDGIESGKEVNLTNKNSNKKCC